VIEITTADNHIFNREQFVIEFIKEMQTAGNASITTKGEGPCLLTNGFYKLLDNICDKFNFDKSSVTITTTNKFEHHDVYQIIKQPFPWLMPAIMKFNQAGYNIDNFINKKNINENLFASFNNRPTWYRLCLINHLRKLANPTLLSCNTSWDIHSQNAIPFNDIADQAKPVYYEILELLKDCPLKLSVGPIKNKDDFSSTLADLFSLYNHFFIDVLGVAYATGDTFYLDEKEARPILCSTPFIIYGTRGHLESMRGHGFHTFSKWWNEDYDNYSGYERILRMCQTIDSIAKLSDAELATMYQDMIPTLTHNYNHLNEIAGRL
jgi:hypothetical protein